MRHVIDEVVVPSLLERWQRDSRGEVTPRHASPTRPGTAIRFEADVVGRGGR